MLIVMASPAAIVGSGSPDTKIANVLKQIKAAGHIVGIVSNHAEPDWFKSLFGSSGVEFVSTMNRQSGKFVEINAEKFKLQPHDVIVLAANEADVQMGKNGGAVLVAVPAISANPKVKALGIKVEDAAQLKEVIELVAAWQGQWWFSGDAAYRVRALADLSTYGQSMTQQIFGDKLKVTVKAGGPRLNALLAVVARSLLMDGVAKERSLIWGVYPSSSSSNNDTEILSDFTHRLRTTVSLVRFCKRLEPLFIRHKPSPQRSAGPSADRTNPESQIETLHLNPFYKSSNRISGRNVVVIDDCTTYGVSFGVAAAFLKKAGAKSVTGVALGKFGQKLRSYAIEIKSSPFSPVTSANYMVEGSSFFAGTHNNSVQSALQLLIP